MICLLGLILAALLPSASVREIPAGVRDEPATTCAAANERLLRRPDERIFFRLEGLVTADLGGRLVLKDGSGFAIVIVSCDAAYRRGDRVSLVCTALQPNPSQHLIAEALDFSLIAHDPLPPPAELSSADVLGGQHAFQEIALSGVVTDAFQDEVDTGWDIIIVESGDAKTMVWIPADTLTDERLDALVDASVRVSGVCFPSLNSSRRYLRNWVQVASGDAIRVTTPPPADPFAGSASPDHRQAFSGTVLATWDERSLFLRTDSGERLEVRLRRGQRLPPTCSRVSVAAFVRSNAFFRRLTNALIRQEDERPSARETPTAIAAREILREPNGRRQIRSSMHGKTVRIRGRAIRHLATGTAQSRLVIDSDGEPVPIWIGDADVPALGSEIEATGVCIITAEPDGDHGFYDKLGGFAVALRDPSELIVLESPPWWTPGRLAAVIATLLALLAAILVWNVSLRLLVERRGRELLRSSIRRVEAELRTEERTRLAVELHDTIAQSLAGVTFELNAADRLSAGNPARSHAHLQMADRTLKSCRDELRNCIWDLRGKALEQTDMNEAIRQALAPHVGDARLLIRFNVPRARLSDNAVHTLLRIIRELAINAVRHGRAGTIRIAGGRSGDRLVFSVRDDGGGFDPSAAPGVLQGHFGLQGIRERVNRFDGDMTVESAPGRGAKVVLSFRMPNGRQPKEENANG